MVSMISHDRLLHLWHLSFKALIMIIGYVLIPIAGDGISDYL
jgi:hypothetical protein